MKKTITKLTAFIAIMLLTTTAYAQEFHLGATVKASNWDTNWAVL